MCQSSCAGSESSYSLGGFAWHYPLPWLPPSPWPASLTPFPSFAGEQILMKSLTHESSTAHGKSTLSLEIILKQYFWHGWMSSWSFSFLYVKYPLGFKCWKLSFMYTHYLSPLLPLPLPLTRLALLISMIASTSLCFFWFTLVHPLHCFCKFFMNFEVQMICHSSSIHLKFSNFLQLLKSKSSYLDLAPSCLLSVSSSRHTLCSRYKKLFSVL